MRPSNIKLGLAILGLGTALATLPAYAWTGDQSSGMAQPRHMARVQHPRAHSEVQTSGQRSGSASNEESRAPGGNTYAFGAQGQPAAAQYHYAIGRTANDGGMGYEARNTPRSGSPTGGQRTGSASNEQAQAPSPNGNLYAFGGQGQPPGAGYHYGVGRAANDGGMNYGMQNQNNGR